MKFKSSLFYGTFQPGIESNHKRRITVSTSQNKADRNSKISLLSRAEKAKVGVLCSSCASHDAPRRPFCGVLWKIRIRFSVSCFPFSVRQPGSLREILKHALRKCQFSRMRPNRLILFKLSSDEVIHGERLGDNSVACYSTFGLDLMTIKDDLKLLVCQ